LRLRNNADAPDLAQEVFLRLMRVEHHESIRSPEAYLFTVASHVLHQHTLRQANTPASIDISEVFAELQLTSDDDPMVRARVQHLQSQGKNPFRDYQLPEAALALKQGVGRLVRSEEDRGVVMICDPRLLGRGYGRALLSVLPPMRPTRVEGEATAMLKLCAQEVALA